MSGRVVGCPHRFDNAGGHGDGRIRCMNMFHVGFFGRKETLDVGSIGRVGILKSTTTSWYHRFAMGEEIDKNNTRIQSFALIVALERFLRFLRLYVSGGSVRLQLRAMLDRVILPGIQSLSDSRCLWRKVERGVKSVDVKNQSNPRRYVIREAESPTIPRDVINTGVTTRMLFFSS